MLRSRLRGRRRMLRRRRRGSRTGKRRAPPRPRAPSSRPIYVLGSARSRVHTLDQGRRRVNQRHRTVTRKLDRLTAPAARNRDRSPKRGRRPGRHEETALGSSADESTRRRHARSRDEDGARHRAAPQNSIGVQTAHDDAVRKGPSGTRTSRRAGNLGRAELQRRPIRKAIRQQHTGEIVRSGVERLDIPLESLTLALSAADEIEAHEPEAHERRTVQLTPIHHRVSTPAS